MNDEEYRKDVKDTEPIREAMREAADTPITRLDLMKNDAYAPMRREGEQVYSGSASEASGEFREESGRFDGAEDLDRSEYEASGNQGEFAGDEGDENDLGDEDDETFFERGETDEVKLPEMDDPIDDSEIDDSSFDCD